VLNLALGLFLLLFLVPLLVHLPGVTRSAQILLIVLAVPLGLLCLGCLLSAARPGTVRRLVRRRR